MLYKLCTAHTGIAPHLMVLARDHPYSTHTSRISQDRPTQTKGCHPRVKKRTAAVMCRTIGGAAGALTFWCCAMIRRKAQPPLGLSYSCTTLLVGVVMSMCMYVETKHRSKKNVTDF